VLDEPTLAHHGGDLAGPVFRRVAEASLRYLGVTPSTSSTKLASLKRDMDGPDATPKAPRPALIPAEAVPAGSVRVPDATGLPAHEVLATLTKAGLVPQFEGWGRVVRQSPAPGSAAPKGSAVRVVLEPTS
jgi:cell division protein FtsI (penicillin-binding protein 3)